MIIFTINSYLDFQERISKSDKKIESKEIIIYEGYLNELIFQSNRIELHCEDSIIRYFERNFNYELINYLHRKLPERDSIKIIYSNEGEILKILSSRK